MKKKTLHLLVITLLSTLLFSTLANSRNFFEDFKANRSYDGAPPIIPHEYIDSLESPTCLSCHQFGGYAPKLNLDIPKTPHPELTSCLQCHVPQKETSTFKNKQNFFPRWANQNTIPQKSLPTAPPVIPHGPQMRINCSTCHGGKGSVAEIKTPHPERQNCLQCHVWQNQKEQLIIK